MFDNEILGMFKSSTPDVNLIGELQFWRLLRASKSSSLSWKEEAAWLQPLEMIVECFNFKRKFTSISFPWQLVTVPLSNSLLLKRHHVTAIPLGDSRANIVHSQSLIHKHKLCLFISEHVHCQHVAQNNFFCLLWDPSTWQRAIFVGWRRNRWRKGIWKPFLKSPEKGEECYWWYPS